MEDQKKIQQIKATADFSHTLDVSSKGACQVFLQAISSYRQLSSTCPSRCRPVMIFLDVRFDAAITAHERFRERFCVSQHPFSRRMHPSFALLKSYTTRSPEWPWLNYRTSHRALLVTNFGDAGGCVQRHRSMVLAASVVMLTVERISMVNSAVCCRTKQEVGPKLFNRNWVE